MKNAIILALLIISTTYANAASHLVAFDSIPESAQIFAKTNFADKKITSVEVETMLMGLITDSYEIKYLDGTEIEFDSDGNWTEISTKNAPLPSNLVPDEIKQYVDKFFKNTFITSIERTNYGFEIELSNDMDLAFDKNFIFLGSDI